MTKSCTLWCISTHRDGYDGRDPSIKLFRTLDTLKAAALTRVAKEFDGMDGYKPAMKIRVAAEKAINGIREAGKHVEDNCHWVQMLDSWLWIQQVEVGD